jgi:hypothetical protein
MRIPLFVPCAFLLAGLTSCSKLHLGASSDAGKESTVAGSALSILDGFEGEIDGFFKDPKTGGQQVPLSVFLKAGKLRTEVPESMTKGGPPGLEKGYIIFDGAAKKLYFVSDAQKQALEIDLNSPNAKKAPLPSFGGPSLPSAPSKPESPPPTVTETGKFDTVAGYKCEYWDIASDHKEATVCVADQSLSWLSIPMTGIPTERAWMLKLLDGKHFPLRFIGYAKDGTTEDARAELTKIDKRSLPDTEFQVPPGYKVVDIEKMLSGLMMGPGGLPGPHPGPAHH